MDTLAAEEHHGERFSRTKIAGSTIAGHRFYNCIWDHCDLSDADLSGSRFVECRFLSSNLSGIHLERTALCDVQFRESKLVGVDFSHVDQVLLRLHFSDSDLSYSLFENLPLRATAFLGCKANSCQFEKCDLTESNFSETMLVGSTFLSCNLSKTDWRSAIDYCFDLRQNRTKGAQVSLPECLSLLTPFGLLVDGMNGSSQENQR